MFKECRHIKSNGHKCGSPAMRGTNFCFYHSRSTRLSPRRQPSSAEPFQLPPLDDPAGVYNALIEVAQAVAASRISLKRARAIIDSLKLAQKILNEQADLDSPAFGMAEDGARLAPELRICTDEDDCSRCEFASTCTNPRRHNIDRLLLHDRQSSANC